MNVKFLIHYFYNVLNKKFILNPNRIFCCKEYIDDKNCKYCENNYYLLNNECILLPEERKILICITYLSIDECLKYEEKFVLDNKIPKNIVLKNCKIYRLKKF